MVKVVEGGQCAATRARFSPGVRIGLHLVAAEATDTPRPIAIETAKTSNSFLKVPLLTSQSPRSSVCLMSGAPALTPKLNSFTRIAYSPGPINHQPSCCGARPSSIIRKPEEAFSRCAGSPPGGIMQGVGPVEKRELARREEEAPVSAEENEALVRRYFEEAWVKRNLAAVDELMVPNYIEHQIPDGRLTSRHSLKQLLA